MKRILQKGTLVLAIIFMLLTIVLIGVFGIPKEQAEAAAFTTITMDTSLKENPADGKLYVMRGASFDITITVSTTRSGYWFNTSFCVGPVTANLSEPLDTAIGAQLHLEGDITTNLPLTYTNTSKDYLANNSSQVNRGILFSVSAPGQPILCVSTDTDVTFKTTIKVDQNFTQDSFRLGIRENLNNYVGTFVASAADAKKDTANTSDLDTSSVLTEIFIRDASDDTSLGDVFGGKPNPDADPDAPDYDPKDGLTQVTIPDDYPTTPITFPYDGNPDDFVIYPKPGDENAKISVWDPETGDYVEITEDKPFPVPLDPTDPKVKIKVIAENGVDEKEYEIEIELGYARLSNITAIPSTSITPVPSNSGLATTFDKDTFAYTVNVPDDTNTAMITGTVLPDIGASTTITLKAENCTIAGNAVSAGSGVPFLVSDIDTDDTLTLTVTAKDGKTTQDYVLTFKIVKTDTTLDPETDIVVKGATSKRIFVNNEDKATAASVDFYYSLVGEVPAKAIMEITVDATSKITVDGNDYDATVEYEAGTYTIVVTAEAGNYATYKIKLVSMQWLELTLESKYQFLHLEEDDDEYGETFYYRRAYGEKGWTHGVDDISKDRFILGQVLPETVIDDFILNINPEQLSLIRIYNRENLLIYDCGDICDNSDSDGNVEFIGTGWRIEFGTPGDACDIVYISVLGDVDGSGIIDSGDVAYINSYIMGYYEFANIEDFLGALVVNDMGVSDSADAATLNSVIMSNDNITNYYWESSVS